MSSLSEAKPQVFVQTTEVCAPHDLLRWLEEGETHPRFFWADPHNNHYMAARGVYASFFPTGTDRFAGTKVWLGDVLKTFEAEDQQHLRALSCFVFDEQDMRPGPWGTCLRNLVWLPRELIVSDGDSSVQVTIQGQAQSDWPDCKAVTDPSYCLNEAEWSSGAQTAISSMQAQALDKVVLGSSTFCALDAQASPLQFMPRLQDSFRQCVSFWVSPSPGVAFFGASPERLISLQDGKLSTVALAGTIPRGQDAISDQSQIDFLAGSRKNQREHGFVVDYIQGQLEALCREVVIEGPSVATYENVFHLRSELTARAQDQLHLLDAVQALHPTPAVAGVPTEKALAQIRQLEAHARGWYAGPLGWITANGEGDFIVGLRSALWVDGGIYLFAGSGLVAESTVEDEWEEIRWKRQAIQSILMEDG